MKGVFATRETPVALASGLSRRGPFIEMSVAGLVLNRTRL
jgi:hypothetical protein